MITDINSEDFLVQKTFAEYLRDALGWETAYALTEETLGPGGTFGRACEREVALVRDLRAAIDRLKPGSSVPSVPCITISRSWRMRTSRSG